MKWRKARSPNGTSAICTPGGYQRDRMGKFGRCRCGAAPIAVSRFVARARCNISCLVTSTIAASHAATLACCSALSPSCWVRLRVNWANMYSHISPCSSSHAWVSSQTTSSRLATRSGDSTTIGASCFVGVSGRCYRPARRPPFESPTGGLRKEYGRASAVIAARDRAAWEREAARMIGERRPRSQPRGPSRPYRSSERHGNDGGAQMPADIQQLPDDLAVPVDDGACDHLTGMDVPGVALPSTGGGTVRLDDPAGPRTVVFVYSLTAKPGEEPPGGMAGWTAIPGARGCTSQACAYRDEAEQFRRLGVRLYGLSTQDNAYQVELAARLGLPYEVLSDAGLELTRGLHLPTFQVEGRTLLKRHTLVIARGRIEHVFYPVFPPDQDASHVLVWLTAH